MKNIGLLLALFPVLALAVGDAKKPDPMDLVYEAEKDNVALIYSGPIDQNGRLTMQNAGSGFLTKDGLVVTANHVLGTTSGIVMKYKNVEYVMRSFYKDHANDIAFIYPVAAGRTKVSYDHLQGLSSIEIKEAMPKEDQDLILIGFPKGLTQNEPKRTLGRFKAVKKDRYREGVDLYECDLPVMEGFSGGPVFTADQQLVGMAISFENQPNSAPYLITYVTPTQNLLPKIKAVFTKEYIAKISGIARQVPLFDLGPDNCPPLKEDQRQLENIAETVKVSMGNKQVVLTKKSAYRAASLLCKDKVKAANVMLNFFVSKEEEQGGAAEAKHQFDLYAKYVDSTNYVSIRFDLDKNKACIVYVTNGQVKERDILVEMPVVANSFYNVEISTVDERLGVYLDNIPVFYDNNLPIQSGQVGIAVDKDANVMFTTFYIRLPKNY